MVCREVTHRDATSAWRRQTPPSAGRRGRVRCGGQWPPASCRLGRGSLANNTGVVYMRASAVLRCYCCASVIRGKCHKHLIRDSHMRRCVVVAGPQRVSEECITNIVCKYPQPDNKQSLDLSERCWDILFSINTNFEIELLAFFCW